MNTESFVKGTHDANTIEQLGQVAQTADRVALCADGHYGYIMPIGGVAAYRDKISVSGVGYDIACGNAAIRTDLSNEKLLSQGRKYLNSLADDLFASLSFGAGRKNLSGDAPIDHQVLSEPAWDVLPTVEVRETLREKARHQLGTIGSGNHYVDVFLGSDGHVWVGVHFGSRGLGHTIASNFLALAAGLEWGARAPASEVGLIDLNSELGQSYRTLMELAGRYAYAGREWVARKVVSMLGANELDLVHNHHNFAWEEEHLINNEPHKVMVVRKGATPAFPGQRGFVGGSMGGISVILQGSESSEAKAEAERLLYSTVHGAGRIMSRTKAAGKRDWKTGVIKEPGLVSYEMMRSAISEADVVLRGGGLDESPHVYRKLEDVLDEHSATIEVLTVLKPLIVCMAGENEVDPYKD